MRRWKRSPIGARIPNITLQSNTPCSAEIAISRSGFVSGSVKVGFPVLRSRIGFDVAQEALLFVRCRMPSRFMQQAWRSFDIADESGMFSTEATPDLI